jgi:hypothetical protein
VIESSSFWPTILSVALHNVMMVGFFYWLRTRYPEDFEKLGRPGFISNNSFRDIGRVVAFLVTFGFLRFRPGFAAYCLALTLNMILAFALVLAFPVYWRSSAVPAS